MNNRQMSKLQELISRRFERLVRELFPPPPKFRGGQAFLSGPSRRKVQEEWKGLCDSLEIRRLEEDATPGHDKVVAHDPIPGGDWLEMSMETANKILILGDLP